MRDFSTITDFQMQAGHKCQYMALALYANQHTQMQMSIHNLNHLISACDKRRVSSMFWSFLHKEPLINGASGM